MYTCLAGGRAYMWQSKLVLWRADCYALQLRPLPRDRSQEYMKKLMLLYQTLELNGDDSTQRWIIEASKAADMDLIPFFEKWRFAVNADTRSRIEALNLPPVSFNIVSGR